MGFYSDSMGLYSDSMGYEWDIPSGDVKSLLSKPWPSGNGVSFPSKNKVVFHSYVNSYQRVVVDVY